MIDDDDLSLVARLARAWIETMDLTAAMYGSDVARLARAWIETVFWIPVCISTNVARLARAWIETFPMKLTGFRRLSPASRGRGLKLHGPLLALPTQGRPPRAGVD